MYFCPVCGKAFELKEDIQKHFLSCWKEEHPYYQSKAAPCSEDITTREVSDSVVNFFNSFNKR